MGSCEWTRRRADVEGRGAHAGIESRVRRTAKRRLGGRVHARNALRIEAARTPLGTLTTTTPPTPRTTTTTTTGAKTPPRSARLRTHLHQHYRRVVAMAESRGSLIAKSVQKHAGRAKEKILQNLGKVDRTADEIFDEHLHNFNKQQSAANRLQKEFNNYIRCVRAAQVASKSFLDAVNEVYETSWSGHDLLYVQTQSIDMMYQDFSHKLGEQVLLPLNTYQSQFPEMKKKIDKRGRKLVDYDAQRHNYQTLQASMAKKRDDTKLSKGRELLDEAKRTYEMLNSELHDELPALYDSRVLFLVTNLQTLFNTEHVFHAETAKVYSELEAIVDKLATDSQRGSYTIKKNGASLPRKIPNDTTPNTLTLNSISPLKNNLNMPTINNTDTSATTPTPSSPGAISKEVSAPSTPGDTINNKTATPTTNNTEESISPIDGQSTTPPTSPPATLEITPAFQTTTHEVTQTTTVQTASANKVEINGNATTTTPEHNNDDEHDSRKLSNANVSPLVDDVAKNNGADSNKGAKKVEELYDIPVGASTDNLPPGVLYRVKSTYKYNREDVDELSFEVGEIIQVIEYDDPEEQEEGWLMGLKESTGEKGMFPANFTKPL